METVPVSEIVARVAGLRQLMAEAGMELALIRQNADLYYYAGTLVDGFLAMGAAQESALLLVRRPQERLGDAKPAWPVASFQDLKEIPQILRENGFDAQGPLGLELDVMPVAFYEGLKKKVFPGRPIKDLSPLIRRQRMVKSPYEIEQLRRAAQVMDRAIRTMPQVIKPGITELEVAAAMEYRLRLEGHEGLVRLRMWGLELFYGHVLSGVSGLQGPYTDTPSGGLGPSAAFPQGAGRKKLAPGEPISLDVPTCINGYIVDMTRMFAIGGLPDRAWEAWELLQELYRIFVAGARPGVKPGELYRRLWEEVQRRGFGDWFMGPGADQVSFLAHGVGLELDEFPFLSARFPYALEENMVLAFEPKIFLPDIGMMGLEDTGRITPEGVEWLTITPREVVIV